MIPLHCTSELNTGYWHEGICDVRNCYECPPHPADVPEQFQEDIHIKANYVIDFIREALKLRGI